MPQLEHQSAIDACVRCAQQCEYCAEVSLQDMPGLAKICFDCAPICWLTSSYLSRRSQFAPDIAEFCADICETCARECEKSALDHLQRCADACRRCASECRNIAMAAV